MNVKESLKLKEALSSLENLPCWQVSCGGAVGTTFQLALGDKIPRSMPLNNPAQTEVYRLHEGQANLLVWCAWRLDGPEGPLVSSDCSNPKEMNYLSQLKGTTLLSCILLSPAGDLLATFDNDYSLYIFCDHVGEDPSFDGNWDLWLQDEGVFMGTSSRLTFEERKTEVVAGS